MRIEILIIVSLVSLGTAFMNYKNKKIRLKMKNRTDNLNTEPVIEQFFDKKTKKHYVVGSENGKEEVKIFHLIPCRFVKQMRFKLGFNTDDWLSIVLSKEEYKIFTKAWQKAIGKEGKNGKPGVSGWTGKTTKTATFDDVIEAAQKIYKDYPEILKALGI